MYLGFVETHKMSHCFLSGGRYFLVDLV